MFASARWNWRLSCGIEKTMTLWRLSAQFCSLQIASCQPINCGKAPGRTFFWSGALTIGWKGSAFILLIGSVFVFISLALSSFLPSIFTVLVLVSPTKDWLGSCFTFTQWIGMVCYWCFRSGTEKFEGIFGHFVLIWPNFQKHWKFIERVDRFNQFIIVLVYFMANCYPLHNFTRFLGMEFTWSRVILGLEFFIIHSAKVSNFRFNPCPPKFGIRQVWKYRFLLATISFRRLIGHQIL